MFRRKKAAAAAEQRAYVCVNGVVCRYGASWSGNVPSGDGVLVQCGRWNRKRKVLLGSDLRPRVSRSAREEFRKAESFDGRRGGKFHETLRGIFDVRLTNKWAETTIMENSICQKMPTLIIEKIFFLTKSARSFTRPKRCNKFSLPHRLWIESKVFFSRGGLQLFTLHA